MIARNALCIIWHAFSSHVTIFCKYIEIHVLVISLFLYRSRRMQHRNKSRFLIIHFWVIPILSSKSIKIYMATLCSLDYYEDRRRTKRAVTDSTGILLKTPLCHFDDFFLFEQFSTNLFCTLCGECLVELSPVHVNL